MGTFLAVLGVLAFAAAVVYAVKRASENSKEGSGTSQGGNVSKK